MHEKKSGDMYKRGALTTYKQSKHSLPGFIRGVAAFSMRERENCENLVACEGSGGTPWPRTNPATEGLRQQPWFPSSRPALGPRTSDPRFRPKKNLKEGDLAKTTMAWAAGPS